MPTQRRLRRSTVQRRDEPHGQGFHDTPSLEFGGDPVALRFKVDGLPVDAEISLPGININCRFCSNRAVGRYDFFYRRKVVARFPVCRRHWEERFPLRSIAYADGTPGDGKTGKIYAKLWATE